MERKRGETSSSCDKKVIGRKEKSMSLEKDAKKEEEEEKEKLVTLRIFRGIADDRSQDRFDVFTVPYVDGMVVLNAIHYIQSHIDPTLSARWNCKAGRCGSCSAEINGLPRLMCKTPVSQFVGKEEITVEPMKSFPFLKDLATDISESFEIAKNIPPFASEKESSTSIWKMQQIDVDKGRELRRCIECFLCLDVCHVFRRREHGYIGPRWIMKTATFDNHPLDSEDRSDWLSNIAGLQYCNISKCCEEVCPEHIKITEDAIIPEKESVLDKRYDPLFSMHIHAKDLDLNQYRKLKERTLLDQIQSVYERK